MKKTLAGLVALVPLIVFGGETRNVIEPGRIISLEAASSLHATDALPSPALFKVVSKGDECHLMTSLVLQKETGRMLGKDARISCKNKKTSFPLTGALTTQGVIGVPASSLSGAKGNFSEGYAAPGTKTGFLVTEVVILPSE